MSCDERILCSDCGELHARRADCPTKAVDEVCDAAFGSYFNAPPLAKRPIRCSNCDTPLSLIRMLTNVARCAACERPPLGLVPGVEWYDAPLDSCAGYDPCAGYPQLCELVDDDDEPEPDDFDEGPTHSRWLERLTLWTDELVCRALRLVGCKHTDTALTLAELLSDMCENGCRPDAATLVVLAAAVDEVRRTLDRVDALRGA